MGIALLLPFYLPQLTHLALTSKGHMSQDDFPFIISCDINLIHSDDHVTVEDPSPRLLTMASSELALVIILGVLCPLLLRVETSFLAGWKALLIQDHTAWEFLS